ncbi:MAG: hypothetical protein WCI06_05335 [Methylococcaceae bacterium]
MGFFSNLFGTHSENTYRTTTTQNVVSASNVSDGHTGVSRYLDEQSSTLSGVAKYLKEQEKNQPSSVTKYLARQAIAEKNKPVVVLSGVAKYLNKNKDSAPIVRTGVEKYLANQDKTPASKVSKYLLQKAIAERNAPPKAKLTRVESYLQNRPETTASSVSKYLAKQSQTVVVTQTKAEVAAVVEAIVNDVALTGVEKYLKAQR